MFKYTKHFLKKTEDLFAELEYVIRYERGSFKSGYCIVEDRQIAVINKFFDTEARINTLMEILQVLEMDVDKLSEQGASHYKALLKAFKNRGTSTIEEEKGKEEESSLVDTEEKETEQKMTEEMESPEP